MNYLYKVLCCMFVSFGVLFVPTASQTSNEALPKLLQRATDFVQEAEYEKALSVYTFYLKFQPDNVQALSQRAVVHASLGDLQLAFEDIDRAFDSAGFSALEQAVIHNHRAQIYFLQRDTDSALQDFNRAIELNPTYPDFWLNRGILHQILGDWDLALADYEEYVQLDPTNAEAFLSIARVYLAHNDYPKALSALDSAIDLTPDDPELYIFRGSVNLLAEQFVPAAGDYSDWLQLINTIEYDESPITAKTDQRTLNMTYGALYNIPFSAESGDRFAVTASSPSVDSLIILLSPDGNPIMANDDGGRGLNAFIVDFTLPEDGTYTLLVGHARGGWDGDIELTVQIVASEDI